MEEDRCTCKDKDREDMYEEDTCPYQEEINDDYEFTCNCCKYCRQECAYDI